MDAIGTTTQPQGRGWPRAAGLFGVVLALSVVRPGVLLAIPILLFSGMGGLRGRPMFAVAAIALFITVTGPRDGLWFVERAWALLVAGWFVGLTMALPHWKLTSRALSAAAGSLAVAALVLVVRADGWAALDWTVRDGIVGSVATTLDAFTVMRQGSPMSPAVVSAMFKVAEAQAAVFPAMIALASVAGVAVAWWVYTRVSGGGDQALPPVGNFRFNDHLVWLMVGGLVLAVARGGDATARFGTNLIVFMSALYALRGAGVVMFVTDGLSLPGYVLFALGLFFVPPVVLGGAILIGIADSYFDLRTRVGRTAA